MVKKTLVITRINDIVSNQDIHGFERGSFQNLGKVLHQVIKFVISDCWMFHTTSGRLNLHEKFGLVESVIIPAVDDVFIRHHRVHLSGDFHVLHRTYFFMVLDYSSLVLVVTSILLGHFFGDFVRTF